MGHILPVPPALKAFRVTVVQQGPQYKVAPGRQHPPDPAQLAKRLEQVLGHLHHGHRVVAFLLPGAVRREKRIVDVDAVAQLMQYTGKDRFRSAAEIENISRCPEKGSQRFAGESEQIGAVALVQRRVIVFQVAHPFTLSVRPQAGFEKDQIAAGAVNVRVPAGKVPLLCELFKTAFTKGAEAFRTRLFRIFNCLPRARPVPDNELF